MNELTKNRIIQLSCATLALVLVMWAGTVVAHAGAVFDAVRENALAPNDGPEGRPLPLAGSWSTGWYPYWRIYMYDDWSVLNSRTFWTPDYMVDLIEAGHHVLPIFTVGIDSDGTNIVRTLMLSEVYNLYATNAVAKLRTHGVPLALESSNFAQPLVANTKYSALPTNENPRVLYAATGLLTNTISVFPPDPGVWTTLGHDWADEYIPQRLMELYPDAPQILHLDNNENPIPRWPQVEEDQRYLDLYGAGQTDDVKRQKYAQGLTNCFGRLFAGMRDEYVGTAWEGRNRFVGYGNAGVWECYGRWWGWPAYSRHYWDTNSALHVTYAHQVWDGCSLSYYLSTSGGGNTDFCAMSMQVAANNAVFLRQKQLQDNPGFWYEMSVWRGGTPHREWLAREPGLAGQVYDANRYKGLVQFGMWLLTPRVVRDFPDNWHIPMEDYGPEYFDAVVDAVDVVHNDPVLERFWRQSELVTNSALAHPYSENLLADWAAEPRWYILNCDLNPTSWPVNLTERLGTELKVFALARVRGEAPNREWLVYAHSPVVDREGVTLTIPGGRDIVVNVPREGTFVHVMETSNNPPMAWPDTASTDRDQSVAVPVLANDRDMDGDSLVLASAWGASHGTVAKTGGTNVTYRPGYGVSGEDVFSYTVSDGVGGLATGQVTVTVRNNPENGLAPEADAYVRSGQYATNNYGGHGTLFARYESAPGDNQQECYLKFALPAMAPDAVESAKVRLHTGARANGTISNAVQFVADDGWGELTLTYSNRPSGGAPGGAWLVPAAGGDAYGDVTDLVKQELAGDGRLSLRVYAPEDAANTAWVSYGSREQTNAAWRPALVIALTNSLPRPGIREFWPMSAGLGLLFDSLTGWVYEVQYKDDLMGTNDWLVLTNGVPGTGHVVEFEDPAGEPRRFYRLKAGT